MIRHIEIDQVAGDLSALLLQAQQGDEIIFNREGHPVARLTPIAAIGTAHFSPEVLQSHDADDYDSPLHEYL